MHSGNKQIPRQSLFVFPWPSQSLSKWTCNLKSYLFNISYALFYHRSWFQWTCFRSSKASKNKFGVDKANELIHAARNSIVVRKSISDGELYNIHSLIDSIDSLESEIRHLEKIIDSKAEEFPAYHVLLTLTGCGKITAATIVAEIGDISRFHKASQIVSLAGLYGDNSKSGSSVNKRGKISKKVLVIFAMQSTWLLNLHEETIQYLKLILLRKEWRSYQTYSCRECSSEQAL